MADNTTLNEGSGGDVIASDDIAGVKHQRVKIEHGADGSATDVSSASPLPVIGGYIKSTPTIITQAVATPGTAEAIAAAEAKAVYVLLCATRVDAANTSNVNIGTSAVDKATSFQVVLPPGAIWEYRAPTGYYLDLNELFVDATTATDGVTGWYQPA